MALELVDSCQLSVDGIDKSSARPTVTRGPESGKLKKLHCLKSLPGNGWLRHSRLENA
jgi:hypothetical protein